MSVALSRTALLRPLPHLLVLLSCLGAHCAHAQAAQDLYQDALQSIAEGRRNDASRELSRVLEDEPQHAGAWVDLAMTQCALGHADEAERLFATVETRFKPSRAMLELIAEMREQGCSAWRPSSSYTLSLGRGIDRNVNQGASTPTFSFDGPEGHFEKTLTDDFLPRHDQYTVASGDYTREVTPNGSIGFTQFQLRRNDYLHAYDSAIVFAGVESSWRLRHWSLRTSATVGLVTLGSHLYQRQAQLQARVGPPLPLPNNTQLSVLASANYSDFVTLANFNSRTYELRAQLSHRNEHFFASASVASLHDHALAQRPGGDREGWLANLTLRRRLAGSVTGDLAYTRQQWNGDSPYAPGLIDDVRTQSTDVLRANLSFAINRNQSLQLEGRVVRNRENISIFQYNNRQIQLSWQWQG